MFACFFYSLLSFCVCEFPTEFETREPGKFIVERASYASISYTIMDLRREREISLEVIFIGYLKRKIKLDVKLRIIQNG